MAAQQQGVVAKTYVEGTRQPKIWPCDDVYFTEDLVWLDSAEPLRPTCYKRKGGLSDCTQRIGPALYTKNYGLFRCGCFLGECSLDDELRGRLLLRQALGLSCKADVEAEEEEEDGPESSNVELQRFFVFGKFRIFVRATRNLRRNEKLRVRRVEDSGLYWPTSLLERLRGLLQTESYESKEEEEDKEERLSDYLEIRKLADKQHPCNGQHGCFALLPYREGEVVCIYAGAVVNMDVGEYESYYNVDYSTQSAPERTSRMRVDASWIGNEARFINDYRGVPTSSSSVSSPNVKLEKVWLGIAQPQHYRKHLEEEEKDHLVVVVQCIRDIAVGEELLLDYGMRYWAS
ncbi:Glucose transport transcription regulator RGT1 [Balamuthia mandrillaris]